MKKLLEGNFSRFKRHWRSVEHADADAFDYILTTYCGVQRGRHGEKLNELRTAVQFALDLDVEGHLSQTDDRATTYDLVRFCGPYHRQHPSEEYLSALSKIAELDGNLKPGNVGIEIKIPVKLQVSSGMEGMPEPASRDYAKILAGITKAEKDIAEQWATYAESAED